MQSLLDALRNAMHLIVTCDPNVLEYTGRSLSIAATSTLIASSIGVPAAAVVASCDFPGRRAVVTILNTLLSMPTVVVGLVVYSIDQSLWTAGSSQLLFHAPRHSNRRSALDSASGLGADDRGRGRTDRDIRKTAIGLEPVPLRHTGASSASRDSARWPP